MTNTRERHSDAALQMEVGGHIVTLSRDEAVSLVASIQEALLDQWRDSRIGIVRATGLRLGRTREGFVLRIDSPEIGPFLLDLGQTGLAELAKAYNRRMS